MASQYTKQSLKEFGVVWFPEALPLIVLPHAICHCAPFSVTIVPSFSLQLKDGVVSVGVAVLETDDDVLVNV